MYAGNAVFLICSLQVTEGKELVGQPLTFTRVLLSVSLMFLTSS